MAGRRKEIRGVQASLLTGIVILLSMTSAQAHDASIGKTIATQGTARGVPACIGCHGVRGEGNASTGFPRLAGLSTAYISEQMAAFASGERQSPIMQPFAKLLSLDERVAVADYFSKLPAPGGIKPQDSASVTSSEIGAWIATRGRWELGLPACVQCHGPGGIGVGTSFPPLAGQPASYLTDQLHHWKNDTRPPGPMALMRVIASKLSDSDITAVATYYAANASVPAGNSNGSQK